MKLENQIIIITSNEAWGDIWYSKHNYAWELAKKNKVFFVNPPKKFKLFNILKKKVFVNKIYENLFIVDYINILPVKNHLTQVLNEYVILPIIKKKINKISTNPLIYWSFDPLRFSTNKLLNYKIFILHLVDKYKLNRYCEIKQVKNADLVLCVSDEIKEQCANYNKKVYTIHHAISNDEFLPHINFTKKTKNGLFIGVIDKRINLNYTEEIIKHFKHVEFNFAGKISEEYKTRFTEILNNYNNVNYLGLIPYKEVKYLIQQNNFTFVYKNIYPGNNIASHKLLHILAQGKPIFSTVFTDYASKELIYMSNSIDKMIKMMDYYLENGETKEIIKKRIDYAQQYTFEKILKQIENLFN